MLSRAQLLSMIDALLSRTNPTVHARLTAALARIYIPRSPFNGWEWSEKNIYIPEEESKERYGPYDSADGIYVRRLFEFITRPHEREFIIRKSSQLGFTLAYILIILYLAATRPVNVLYAMDSAKEAKNISRRIKQLITHPANAALLGILSGEGEDDLQNLFLTLRGMLVWLIGSGAAGGFANKAAGLVILDELDLYELLTRKGHDMFARGLERIKDSEGGKFIAGGKPEEFDFPTNINYLQGTREELFLPCKLCDVFQPIHWENIRFEHCKDVRGHYDFPKVIAETYCECVACRGRILQEHKGEMLRRYECRATNTGQDDYKPIPGRVSLWVNDLYSTRPQHAWGHLAKQFITAQMTPSALRVFFTGVLARPPKESKTEVTKSDLAKLNGGYEHGCMPKRPAIHPESGRAAILLTSDVQGNGEKKWVKVGFTPEGEAFVIDYGQTLGFHDLSLEAAVPVWLGTRAPPEKELEDIRSEAIATGRDYYAMLRERYPGREFYTVPVGGLDEGHDTFEVRDFCHTTKPDPDSPPLFFPFKGIPRATAQQLVEEIPDKFRTAKEGGEYITVYHFSDDDIKRDLYIGRIGGFDSIKSGKSTIARLWFPAHAEEWFLVELRQEKRELVLHKGKRRWMWIDPTAPNDYGDALKIALALWHIVRPTFVVLDGGGETPPPPPAESVEGQVAA